MLGQRLAGLRTALSPGQATYLSDFVFFCRGLEKQSEEQKKSGER